METRRLGVPERFQSVNSIESGQKLGFRAAGVSNPVAAAFGRSSTLPVHDPQGSMSIERLRLM